MILSYKKNWRGQRELRGRMLREGKMSCAGPSDEALTMANN